MGRGLDGLIPVCWFQLCSFEGPRSAVRADAVLASSGGFGVGETPLPIPNRAVKPHSADGTWPSRARESRSPPVYPSRAARGAARGREPMTRIPATPLLPDVDPDRLELRRWSAADADELGQVNADP